MPGSCCILSCQSRKNQDRVSFFRIPKETNTRGKPDPIKAKRRLAWIKAIGRTDLVGRKWNNVRICSRHFITGAPSANEFEEYPDWIPSLFMEHEIIVPNGGCQNIETDLTIKTEPIKLSSEQKIVQKELFANNFIKTEPLEVIDPEIKDESETVKKEVVYIKTENSRFSCEFCYKSFNHSRTLKDHKNIHTGERPYACNVCNQSFRQSQHLKRHQFTHTGEKPFTCNICNKSFTHLQSLNQHKLLHNSEKPFSCEICDESFNHSRALKEHKNLHTGEFTCEVCNKSFGQSHHLKRHSLTHTGEKPFSCEVCNESFRQLKNLKQHKLLHTGEKPFTCEVCSKSFRQSFHLKKHRLIHTGEKPYDCEACNKSFRQLITLKRHLSTHTDRKLFICNICSKSFTSKQNLQKHLMIHNKEPTEEFILSDSLDKFNDITVKKEVVYIKTENFDEKYVCKEENN